MRNNSIMREKTEKLWEITPFLFISHKLINWKQISYTKTWEYEIWNWKIFSGRKLSSSYKCDTPNFINWIQQQIKVKQLISSEPHLRLISPRRFDKTSLVQKSNEGTAKPRATAKLTVSDRYWRLSFTFAKTDTPAIPFRMFKTSSYKAWV